MTTTAVIVLMHEDDTLTTIKVNRDGHPEYAGETLMKYYPSPAKIEELFKGGDLLDLEKKIDKCLYCKDDIDDWGRIVP